VFSPQTQPSAAEGNVMDAIFETKLLVILVMPEEVISNIFPESPQPYPVEAVVEPGGKVMSEIVGPPILP